MSFYSCEFIDFYSKCFGIPAIALDCSWKKCSLKNNKETVKKGIIILSPYHEMFAFSWKFIFYLMILIKCIRPEALYTYHLIRLQNLKLCERTISISVYIKIWISWESGELIENSMHLSRRHSLLKSLLDDSIYLSMKMNLCHDQINQTR